jgi:alkanesulfonate monooxygenase SsuD/methylene tetrahydromethanopterin reductase-like flavin-dependent oxidoreductase (luciferase family)
MLVEIFGSTYIENSQGKFWRVKRLQTQSRADPEPHPPVCSRRHRSDSAIFAGKSAKVGPAWLSWYPLGLVCDLTSRYRQNLPEGRPSDVILGLHLHVARDRRGGTKRGLRAGDQSQVFLRSGAAGSAERGEGTYATKSESRRAFEKLSEPAKARQAVAEESPNIMAVWGTPDECIERIRYYVDSVQPEQLMLNIASGSLAQEKILKSMRLCAEEVMPALCAGCDVDGGHLEEKA